LSSPGQKLRLFLAPGLRGEQRFWFSINIMPVDNQSSKEGTVSLIIPTLRRPEHLARCLASLVPQTKPANEILVGIRADDHSNDEVLRTYRDRLPVRAVEAKGVGVVGSMNSCLREASGDYVGLLDDDIELPPNWIERMVGHIRSKPDVYAAGGRDLLQDHPEMRRNEPVTQDVGRFYWFGRITGNHHRGGGKARKVDILRGSNFLLRGDFLREVGFEADLRGKGAQVNWELALALQARQRGARFIYDPQVEVIHHVGPRFDSDSIHRGGFDFAGTVDIAYNETLVLLKHGRGRFRVTANLWQLLVGSAVCPGLLHVFRQLLSNRSHLPSRVVATVRGRLEAAKFCLGRREKASVSKSARQPSTYPLSSQAIRLAIVMPSAHPHGGAEEALVHLLRNQAAAQLSAVLVILLEEGELKEVFKSTGAAVEVVPSGRLREPWKQVAAVLKIRKLLKRDRMDAVLGWMTKAHIYGGPAARLAGVSPIYFQMGVPDNGAVDRLSRMVPAVGGLACSDFAAREQQACVRHRVLGVALAADVSRFSEAAKHSPADTRRRLGLDPDRPLVGIVGRLQRWKGMHVYVEAMSIVLKEVPNCQGVIVGGRHHLEPDYADWLTQRLQALGVSKQVPMVGVQRNVPEWMQAMDVVVHASEREPFGIVVVEAMALGKPVVATRPGGPEEIITDGSDGQLVTWNKPEELAEAILKFLRDPEWARSVGQRAKQRSAEYTMEKYAQRVGNALRKLLE
jgi:glycosyltransferase involved in cell wall biosynthesis/GT2 family glycosyltransferase